MDGRRPNRHNQRVMHRWLWALLAPVTAVYIVMVGWAISSGSADSAGLLWMFVMVPGYLGASVILLWKRPRSRIGHLLVAAAIAMFAIPTIAEIPTLIIFERSGVQSWMWAPVWGAMTLNLLAAVLLTMLIVLLPDGRVRHRGERRFLRAAWIVVILPALSLVSNETVVTHSQAFPGLPDIETPLLVSALAPLGDLLSSLVALSYSIFLVAIVMQVMRYRSATTRERKQVRWVLFGGCFAILIGIIPFLLESLGLIRPIGHTLGIALFTIVPFIAFPTSVVIAVLEPPWVDIDIVIRKSFVYGALSFVILLLYVAVAASLGMAAGARLDVEVAVVLTVVVALLFQPARRRLQTVADRWVFGVRPSKYEAVAEVGASIEQAVDPTEMLPRLATTIQRTLDLAWVEVSLDDGTVEVVGEPDGPGQLTVPIGSVGDPVGEIRCGAGRSIATDDRRLVETLASQVGMAVVNARLAARIVNATEAERRRIERNIHDGAQQELVALVARLGMAKAAAGNGGITATDIEELQREARRILSDLRELAQGIHPSVLSDGGILEAVEDRCARLPIDVALEHSEGLRAQRFDDEIEGAAYFFISESLANVLKHAEARHADVAIERVEDQLRLLVRDDGCGFDPGMAPGHHGLAGLQDRIAALGGSVTISSRTGQGTEVVASIPVGRP